MRNCFVFNTGEGEQSTVLRVAKVLQRSPVSSLTDTYGADYWIVRYEDYTPVRNDVNEELWCVNLRCNFTAEDVPALSKERHLITERS